MSIQATTNAAAGVPPVNQALEPEWVRHGSAATQKAYQSALVFEQTLVEQLSKSLTSASGLSGESAEGESGSEVGGSSTSEAGDSQLSSMLPQALASGVMNAGGLGMAAQMTRQLESVQSGAQTPATGATTPVASSDTAPVAAPVAATASAGGAAA
jgi:Rod binding domain-containing protein